MSEAVLFDNVSRQIDRSTGLRDVSFAVGLGEIVALVDPQPAHTTTALRLIAGLDRPDRGSITAYGFDVWSQRSILRHRIAYLPVAAGSYPDLTVHGYLAFFEEVYGIPVDQRGALTVELLELVDLLDDAETPVDALSSTRRKWLDVARCLIHDPDLLLLDQPILDLPREERAELGDMLAELQRLGKTVIVSSLDPLHTVEPFSRIVELPAGSAV